MLDMGHNCPSSTIGGSLEGILHKISLFQDYMVHNNVQAFAVNALGWKACLMLLE